MAIVTKATSLEKTWLQVGY